MRDERRGVVGVGWGEVLGTVCCCCCCCSRAGFEEGGIQMAFFGMVIVHVRFLVRGKVDLGEIVFFLGEEGADRG